MTTSASLAPELVEGLLAAATAAAELLPSSSPLNVGNPVTDLAAIPLPTGAAAVTARLTGSVRGALTVVVGGDLVEALASSPLGSLELAPAVQPAMQAAAATFGSTDVETGREVPADVAFDSLAGFGTAVAIPLMADGEVHAVFAAAVAAPSVPAQRGSAASRRAGLDLLRDVEMEVTAELGRTRMTVRELLSLAPGNVVELDRMAGSPADLLVNGTLVARGEVVVVDEDFGIRITEIVTPGTEGDAA
ncbi:MAG: flagellar motor switch protein FliN [Actinomycetota bacterium]|nr:flagellar motor switch protein FliN [Actinomycetota bacterium]